MTAACLVVAATPPPATASLTPDQRRELDRMFVCPANLPDDAARIAAMQGFIKRYAELAPRSRPAEQLAYYEDLERRKKCPRGDHELIHTIPES